MHAESQQSEKHNNIHKHLFYDLKMWFSYDDDDIWWHTNKVEVNVETLITNKDLSSNFNFIWL